MITKIKKSFLVLILALLAFAYAEDTSIPGVYRYRLENGLELFIAENNSAPLAYIEIAVRAGAVTQNPENAGLFHLYEHMMFKGNEKYENQKAFMEGADELGQIGQNGSTSIDRVNYFFTIPSDLVRNGLEFWSYAVRTPKLDEQELENEKAVVLSEINAHFSDPSYLRTAELFCTMFPDSPWRTDPSGNPVNVQQATADTLRQIQKDYYIPANSAIFVGGNVDHEEVYYNALQIFSDWENPPEMVPVANTENKNPLSSDKKLVFVNPGASSGLIQAGYYLRGPDGETDASDTYAADVWLKVANNPNSVLAKTFVSEPSLGIPQSDYVGASYPTRRLTSLIGFYATMLASDSEPTEQSYGIGKVHSYTNTKASLNPVDKAEKFLSVLKEKAVPAMLDTEKFFSGFGLPLVKQHLEDERIYSLESAQSILAILSVTWSTCGSDYFFAYDENIAQVTEEDVAQFIRNYIENKNGALIVTVSPDVWEKYKQQFIGRGYEEITAEKALWFKSYTGAKSENE